MPQAAPIGRIGFRLPSATSQMKAGKPVSVVASQTPTATGVIQLFLKDESRSKVVAERLRSEGLGGQMLVALTGYSREHEREA